jgi:hypothetical protein
LPYVFYCFFEVFVILYLSCYLFSWTLPYGFCDLLIIKIFKFLLLIFIGQSNFDNLLTIFYNPIPMFTFLTEEIQFSLFIFVLFCLLSWFFTRFLAILILFFSFIFDIFDLLREDEQSAAESIQSQDDEDDELENERSMPYEESITELDYEDLEDNININNLTEEFEGFCETPSYFVYYYFKEFIEFYFYFFIFDIFFNIFFSSDSFFLFLKFFYSIFLYDEVFELFSSIDFYKKFTLNVFFFYFFGSFIIFFFFFFLLKYMVMLMILFFFL